MGRQAPPGTERRLHAGSSYRPEIDGLRAVAVLAVLLFHFDIAPFSGGFVGVDVFFVISGYLITTNTLGELRAGRFSVLAFYERRLRRIVPALAVTLAISSVLCLFVFLPPDLRFVGSGLTAAATFTSNILFYTASNDYFAADNLNLQPMLHSWSLSVEAQFYLLYPWLLLIVHRRGWPLVPVLVGAAGLSLAASAWGVLAAPNATFYLLPTRAWELLCGGILAASGSGAAPQRLRAFAASAGLVLIAVPIVLFTRSTPFPGPAALPACLGAVLLIWAGDPIGDGAVRASGPVGRCLRAPPVVFIGRISYSLYLWHWPILVFASYGRGKPPSLDQRLGLILLSVAMAILSWALIERPMLTRRVLGRTGRLYAGALGAVLVTALLGVGVDHAGRGEIPLVFLPAPVLALANGQFDRIDGDCKPPALDGAPLNFCRFGAPEVAPSVAVWGNSYARMWLPGFDRAARSHQSAGLLMTRGKCLPIDGAIPDEPPDCPAFNGAALAYIAARPELKTVVLGANWFVAGNRMPGLGDTIARLQALGRKVVVLLAPLEPTYSVPRTLAMAALRHEPPPPPILEAEARALQADSTTVIEALRQRLGFDVIDPASFLCDGVQCAVERDGRPLFYDAGHVTLYAARLGAGLFDRVFAP